MLKTNVLVRNVKNLHDARYCAGMGVEFISMPIANAIENTLQAPQINEISEWLSGIKIAGYAQNFNISDLNTYKIDAIEITSPELVHQYKQQNIPVILSLDVTVDILESEGFKMELEKYKNDVSFFTLLFNNDFNEYESTSIKVLIDNYHIYWGFKFSVKNINQFIDSFKPKGIVLYGSEEIKTGINDFDYLADILEALDTDEYA